MWPLRRRRKGTLISDLLLNHFGKTKPEDLYISGRQIPYHVRIDLQKALEPIVGDRKSVRRFCGVRQDGPFPMFDLASLLAPNGTVAVPPQYEEVEIGEERPATCLKIGLWLMETDGVKSAILLSPQRDMMDRQSTVQLQIAAFNNEAGRRLTDQTLRSLEAGMNRCPSYRGKILSLEGGRNYTGRSSGIKVHKLRRVEREQVIVPKSTLDLLDRNVIEFVRKREQLASIGQSTMKGVLFYGPPGTGKSHTIHYLAGALTGHTMLLITAEQVQSLAEYMTLARLLQPSVVVIEDVDLIARERSGMVGPHEQTLLNKLLNEMDGLKEKGEILFILTTNRPEVLEGALASRPGRIDQAIEFPLPDAASREKLVRLYAGGTSVSDDIVGLLVKKTDKTSGAFIRELMRRSVQYLLDRNDGKVLASRDVELAIDEMLMSGGSLNMKLLGGNSRAGFDAELRGSRVWGGE